MITHFAGNLAGGLETGHVLVVGGKSIDEAQDFEVALASGKGGHDDIQLSVWVRFDSPCIVRRIRTDGEWSEEEREENLCAGTTCNPIVSGETFKFYILIGDASFIISVDGQPFCTYAFRLPIEQIRTVRVHGDVQCVSQIDHRRVFPFLRPVVQVDDRKAEFSHDFPMELRPGHIIVITGIPFGVESGWFDMRLHEGTQSKQAFHFNPRFGPRGCVVRNSQNDELKWNFQLEERDGEMPFTMNLQFRMAIAFTRSQFLVAIDGNEFCTFTYRSKNQLSKLNGLKMMGSFGGHIEVTALDHVLGGPADCPDYDRFSDPNLESL